MNMKIDITLDKKVDLKNCTLIEGFPGIGLVGTIAAGYIIEKRNMVPIGHIYSDSFPPTTTIHKGRPYFPARIYKDPKGSFCVLIAEFVIPSKTVHALSEAILNFAKENKIKQIVSLAGMTSAKEIPEAQIYAIVSNGEMERYMTRKKVKMIKEGITTGVSGILIAKCAVENFPAISLLAEARHGYPDPRAAATLIEKLDDLIGLDVDTRALLKEAGQIELKMRKLIGQMKRVKTTYKKAEEEDLPMYG